MILQFHNKPNIPHDPVIPVFDTYVREIKHMSVQRLDQEIYRKFICHNQKLETIQM